MKILEGFGMGVNFWIWFRRVLRSSPPWMGRSIGSKRNRRSERVSMILGLSVVIHSFTVSRSRWRGVLVMPMRMESLFLRRFSLLPKRLMQILSMSVRPRDRSARRLW